MALELGQPAWTTGGFTRVAAQDDLGLESVGAGLLRRLLPGIVQTTPNAGYFSYYPYLLARWEDASDSVKKADYKPWYRRQEAAFAVACYLHEHRDGAPLIGINGWRGSNRAVTAAGDQDAISLARMAEPSGYMDSPFGGYGLFYGRVLADVRLTRLGSPGQVDRVTDLGREVVERFAVQFEATDYFRRWFEEPEVPTGVLAELGEVACLCSIPGRPDHEPLLDVFFRRKHDDPGWEARRVTRVESLDLFLSFHDQRPAEPEPNLGMFRRALLTGEFPHKEPWRAPSRERFHSWRAYQLREASVLALGSIWSSFLLELDEIGPSPQVTVRDRLVVGANWNSAGLSADVTTGEALGMAREFIPDGSALVDVAEQLADSRALNRDESVPLALAMLLRIRTLTDESAAGFDELLDEGSSLRWSLQHQSVWLDHRTSSSLSSLLADLVDALVNQHRRVAFGKVRILDTRDPFCVAEDDGVLTTIRTDEPFWTGARYGVVNHFLWTLGLLTSIDGDPRLTKLGRANLAESESNA